MEKLSVILAGEDVDGMQAVAAVLCRRDGFCILGCFALQDVKEEALRQQPEIILICCRGQGEGILALVNELQKVCPGSRLILISDGCSPRLAYMAYQAGIGGVLSRYMLPANLVSSIELICQAGVFCWNHSNLSQENSVAMQAVVVSENKENKENKEIMGLLTARELEILQLMALNYSNKEIAQKLYVSEPTVKTHVSSILRKLGQSNRTRAILYGFKTGLLELPELENQSVPRSLLLPDETLDVTCQSSIL
ncbi:LuxR C-terminal-related transcriptional regulator [Desulfofundulus sp.]|uniref:LuxR C-terminal-related transcriptional regulator n=1 Tax=Desulfofundulus sp. TaxID=2282750 RepID=UPI003C7442B3